MLHVDGRQRFGRLASLDHWHGQGSAIQSQLMFDMGTDRLRPAVDVDAFR